VDPEGSANNRNLLLGEGAGVATIAGKIFVDGINVEKAMPFGVQFCELLAAALGKN